VVTGEVPTTSRPRAVESSESGWLKKLLTVSPIFGGAESDWSAGKTKSTSTAALAAVTLSLRMHAGAWQSNCCSNCTFKALLATSSMEETSAAIVNPKDITVASTLTTASPSAVGEKGGTRGGGAEGAADGGGSGVGDGGGDGEAEGGGHGEMEGGGDGSIEGGGDGMAEGGGGGEADMGGAATHPSSEKLVSHGQLAF